MDSPTSSRTRIVAAQPRETAEDAVTMKGCGFNLGAGIEREELRRRLMMPEKLRLAMWDCIKQKDSCPPPDYSTGDGNDGVVSAPEAPIVVFINSRSGGRHGPMLKERLQQLISDEQVFDLLDVKPHEFVRYGLGCLEKLAVQGDESAKISREKLRIVVAGGDGTVGWVLGCLGELKNQGREPVPPVAIIPLGTGNDLSRSFGWGGSFPFVWRSAVKKTLHRASIGSIARLDSWQVQVSMPCGETIELPHSLKHTEDCDLNQDLSVTEELAAKTECYEGVFYNYFSIGMDAQVAYGFHHLRNEKPHLAQGPISNKIIYSSYSCSQGWFFTPCVSDPSLRGLKNILRLHIRKVNCSEWEQIHIPKSVRAVVALNLHNYGSGRNPWGKLEPEYLEKKGFVQAHCDDGLIEIFGFKHGWHASFVMTELITAKHIAQAAAVRFELRGGDWKDAFLQMDGEPWKQPMAKDYSTFIEIKRVPFQSPMINGQ